MWLKNPRIKDHKLTRINIKKESRIATDKYYYIEKKWQINAIFSIM